MHAIRTRLRAPCPLRTAVRSSRGDTLRQAGTASTTTDVAQVIPDIAEWSVLELLQPCSTGDASSVSEATIRRVAQLAGLSLDENQVQSMKNDFSNLLLFAKGVQTVNVRNVEPMWTPHSERHRLVVRSDTLPGSPGTKAIVSTLTEIPSDLGTADVDTIVKGAADHAYPYFTAPKSL
ncbi:hypothetical protein CYMTET_32067 [Cymbomonas tetramitiformis]|uniref:Uncharacterized protein n=1 Tax=Cymbomonas tetramitiformis TaxID=36881 RepID=A0AAE0FFR4_9CHLO|nr:hypothetical protein CYMTET_32067 [Cymbomonas tetramitiformis]